MPSKDPKIRARASKNQNEKRKGNPCFSTVRLDDNQQLEWLSSILQKFGSTRKAALLRAFSLLEKELEAQEKKDKND